MERQVESAPFGTSSADFALHINMLGPLTLLRQGVPLALPASRKARALLAYLAIAPRPVGRSRLCELMWDVPNDPRGELRWCLSKLRSVVDEPGRHRIVTTGDMIALDLTGCFVDVLEIAAAVEHRPEALSLDALQALATLFSGDFLEGLHIERSPHFESWLLGQRRRFRACHISMMERLVAGLPTSSDEAFPYLEKWVELAPFDGRAHMALLGALAQRGKLQECEAHLVATARLFDAEGIDFRPVRGAWQALKNPNTATTVAANSEFGVHASAPEPAVTKTDTSPTRHASLAVMPFLEQTERGSIRGGMADGLTHDIITKLAKLRDIFIIARGSVFALAEQGLGPEEAGRRLNVDYVASGKVERISGRIRATIELVEARTSRIVWADTFDQQLDSAFTVLDEIGNRIVSSISSEIEVAERNRAILKPPNSLNAWEAYHRGLWHMHRFTRAENVLAQQFFEMAIGLDPTFARSYAGLSFTHWQNAFQNWSDRAIASDKAFEAAGQSLIVDDHNPAAHMAMGRALWLRGRQTESLDELERAVDLSPNFALGHYALAFVHCQSGDAKAAIRSSDHSRLLSPFDPLLFGMLGTRAMAHVRLGQFEDAAEWGVKAAARPNAHENILAIAAHCLALAGRAEEGRVFTAAIHKSLPQYSVDDFLTSFHFSADAARQFREVAKDIGLDA